MRRLESLGLALAVMLALSPAADATDRTLDWDQVVQPESEQPLQ